MESLIKAGAMDQFGNRASLLISLSESTNKASQIKKQASDGQESLFGEAENEGSSDSIFVNTEIEDFTTDEKLAFEKEFLGFYLSSHPHLKTLAKIKSVTTHEIDALSEEPTGGRVKIGGIVDSLKKIFTKKSNSEMAFISLADEKGVTIECVIFPRIFELYKHLLVNDNVVIIDGKLDSKEDRPVIIADSIYDAKSQIGLN